MDYNLPDRTLRDIRRLAKQHGIEKVILFGSRAKGIHTERSDIDLAIQGGDFDAFYWDIKENLWSLLLVDIVDLSANVSDKLKEEIERDGVIIYE